MAFNSPVAVEASSAKTATGNSAAAITIDDPGSQLALLVNVSAVSGTTPTLDLKVQWSHDGGTTWADAEAIDSFTQITAAKVVVKIFARKAPHFRLFWTIGGTTPSFTFGVTRTSH